MRYFLTHFLFVNLFILIILIFYTTLKRSIKNKCEAELKKQREDLACQVSEFQQLQQKIHHDNQLIQSEIEIARNALSIQEKETQIKQQQFTETLSNAKKIQKDAELKLMQVFQENQKLKNELISARQRSKRLANKLKSGA